MEKTNGRDAARRMLGADSDLVKAARGTDSALGVNKEDFDHGQYQAFRKGGMVKPKKMSVVDSFKTAKTKKITAPVVPSDGAEMPAFKAGGKIMPLPKGKMKQGGETNAQKAAASTVATGKKKFATGGTVALPKGMARVKKDTPVNGQETQPELIAKKACGGKMKKYALGGSGKIEKGEANASGKAAPGGSPRKFARGGAGKIRLGMATPSGKPVMKKV